MAKTVQAVKLPVKAYVVTDEGVGKMLGPFKVLDQGGRRIVMLNEKQAKYYLVQGAITEA